MPRGPADRPIRGSEEDLALQAAMNRALQQGAAPVAVVGSQGAPPHFGSAVAETAPLRRVEGVARTKAARSFALAKMRRKATKESAVPDPLGRGARVDVRR